MADKRISELDAAVPLTGAELLPIVQDGATRRATAADLGRTLIDVEADMPVSPGQVVRGTVTGRGVLALGTLAEAAALGLALVATAAGLRVLLV
ncbi:MAG: hypothetical protein HQL41_17490, partial [Alphaproteobacteria bacterium]|nr:hypothetical protein [Alphaproteobacteria bacterium]